MNSWKRLVVLVGSVVVSSLTACGPDADGGTEGNAEQVAAPTDDVAKSEVPPPSETVKPQKLKQHVD